jgi:DNA-binding MarR family transcriptional regulator
METIDQFEQLGLNKKQAKVLLATLEVGPASISEIAKRAGQKRPTAYNLMDELLDNGLVVKTSQGKRVFYQSISPRQMVESLDQKKRELENNLPRLESLFLAKGNRPKIHFYEGKSGLRQVYEEMAKTHKKVWSVFSLDDFSSVFSEDENIYLWNLLRSSGGQLYCLIKDTPAGREYVQNRRVYTKGMSQMKVLPSSFNAGTDILIAGDRVALLSFKSLVGIIIEDQAIADSQAELVKYIWQNA